MVFEREDTRREGETEGERERGGGVRALRQRKTRWIGAICESM